MQAAGTFLGKNMVINNLVLPISNNVSQSIQKLYLKNVANNKKRPENMPKIKEALTNRSLLAHLYWVLVHMGRHRVTPPI